MGMIRVGLVRKSFDPFLAESLENPVDGAEGNACCLMDLLDGPFPVEDRTDEFIALGWVHSVVSRAWNRECQPYERCFLTSGFDRISTMWVDSAGSDFDDNRTDVVKWTLVPGEISHGTI